MSLVEARPRTLGSLPPVGPLSFGLWRFTDDDVGAGTALLETALDAGMNLIDNADVYGFDWGGTGFGSVEENLGRVLAVAPHLRDRMVLATKGGIMPPIPYDSSPTYLRSACEASLQRMGVEVIDLYQIHRPDLLTHPADVAATLAALRDEGKIREVGVSNHTPAQVGGARRTSPVPDRVEPAGVLGAAPRPDARRHLRRLHGARRRSRSRGARSVADVSPPVTTSGPSCSRCSIRSPHAKASTGPPSRSPSCWHIPRAPVAIIGSQNPARIAGTTAALDVELTRSDVYAIIQASEGVPLP